MIIRIIVVNHWLSRKPVPVSIRNRMKVHFIRDKYSIEYDRRDETLGYDAKRLLNCGGNGSNEAFYGIDMLIETRWTSTLYVTQRDNDLSVYWYNQIYLQINKPENKLKDFTKKTIINEVIPEEEVGFNIKIYWWLLLTFFVGWEWWNWYT